jgi:hypothetical protein
MTQRSIVPINSRIGDMDSGTSWSLNTEIRNGVNVDKIR